MTSCGGNSESSEFEIYSVPNGFDAKNIKVEKYENKRINNSERENKDFFGVLPTTNYSIGIESNLKIDGSVGVKLKIDNFNKDKAYAIYAYGDEDAEEPMHPLYSRIDIDSGYISAEIPSNFFYMSKNINRVDVKVEEISNSAAKNFSTNNRRASSFKEKSALEDDNFIECPFSFDNKNGCTETSQFNLSRRIGEKVAKHTGIDLRAEDVDLYVQPGFYVKNINTDESNSCGIYIDVVNSEENRKIRFCHLSHIDKNVIDEINNKYIKHDDRVFTVPLSSRKIVGKTGGTGNAGSKENPKSYQKHLHMVVMDLQVVAESIKNGKTIEYVNFVPRNPFPLLVKKWDMQVSDIDDKNWNQISFSAKDKNNVKINSDINTERDFVPNGSPTRKICLNDSFSVFDFSDKKNDNLFIEKSTSPESECFPWQNKIFVKIKNDKDTKIEARYSVDAVGNPNNTVGSLVSEFYYSSKKITANIYNIPRYAVLGVVDTDEHISEYGRVLDRVIKFSSGYGFPIKDLNGIDICEVNGKFVGGININRTSSEKMMCSDGTYTKKYSDSLEFDGDVFIFKTYINLGPISESCKDFEGDEIYYRSYHSDISLINYFNIKTGELNVKYDHSGSAYGKGGSSWSQKSNSSTIRNEKLYTKITVLNVNSFDQLPDSCKSGPTW